MFHTSSTAMIDLQLARQRQQPLSITCCDLRPGVLVRRGRVDDRRHEQHRVGAPQLRVAQRGFHAGDAADSRRRGSALESGNRQ